MKELKELEEFIKGLVKTEEVVLKIKLIKEEGALRIKRISIKDIKFEH